MFANVQRIDSSSIGAAAIVFLPAIPRLVTSHLPRRSFRVLVRTRSWLGPSRLIKYSFSSGRPNPRPPRWDRGNRDRERRQINQKRNGRGGEPLRRQPPLPGTRTPVADVISGSACPFAFPSIVNRSRCPGKIRGKTEERRSARALHVDGCRTGKSLSCERILAKYHGND